MTPATPNITAIWVRFTPYLVEWTEKEYGTGLKLGNHHVLELRPLHGIKQIILHNEVELDSTCMKIETDRSLSQLQYDIINASIKMDACYINDTFGIDDKMLKTFLPVSVPPYLLTTGGVIRPFSRIMYISHKAAGLINKTVYQAFWANVHAFAQNKEYDNDKDMIESYIEEKNLPDIYIDDLRRQYQRMKRLKVLC